VKFCRDNKRIILAGWFALLLPVTAALAADQQRLFGKWGTDAQCSRALLIPNGTKKAAPFDIRPNWLAHGDVWCRLIWLNAGTRSGNYFSIARALCGEDAVRNYYITFTLSNEELVLDWNLPLKNGPLKRCTQ
jgi:hypothetical protein